ncbi:MAG: undecaprenyl-diphosphate phosphatase [Lachnospiraceae bacterium]|nr:undecaprenyl-diphosphate phosphatase [Lachnospiraceae bacterium]
MSFLDWLRVVVLGIIEGVTEWIPVSSTGHLMLLDRLWPGNAEVFTPAFTSMFNVIIQLGAILAVITVFFHKLNPVSSYKAPDQKKNTLKLWAKILIGVIPVGIAGIFLDDLMDEYLYNEWVVAAMLILYGVIFLIVETVNKDKEPKYLKLQELPYKTALFIGLFQILALVPGTSRSGVTILAALLLGCSRYVATEFTFFMAVPIMFGASALKLGKYIFIDKIMPTGTQWGVLIVAMAVAYGVSLLVIKWVLQFVKRHDFKGFGVYRILLGILMILLFLLLA